MTKFPKTYKANLLTSWGGPINLTHFTINVCALHPNLEKKISLALTWKIVIRSGSVFCLLLRVSLDYAQPITGRVTEVTCPVIGWAQPELTPSKRQKTGPGHSYDCWDVMTCAESWPDWIIIKNYSKIKFHKISIMSSWDISKMFPWSFVWGEPCLAWLAVFMSQKLESVHPGCTLSHEWLGLAP